MVCTFFGHRDTPEKIEPMLKSALMDLIMNKNVDKFYVGNEGKFDYMARRLLKEMKVNYPHINYAVVLAYMPGKRGEFDLADYSDTIYPDCLADVPLKFAIAKRNMWMIDRADCVLTYVRGVTGGAFKFKQLAEKKGKTVINLADIN